MISIKLAPVTFVCMVGLAIAFKSPINLRLNIGKTQLNYLGTVDGKSFFVEQSVSIVNFITWLEAKAFCNASGMRLASITTEAQLSLLRTKYSDTTFKTVWTGARDSLMPAQLSWDHNNEVLNSTLHMPMPFHGIQTCAFYHPRPTENYLHATLCTDQRSVLCEISTGKRQWFRNMLTPRGSISLEINR